MKHPYGPVSAKSAAYRWYAMVRWSLRAVHRRRGFPIEGTGMRNALCEARPALQTAIPHKQDKALQWLRLVDICS